MQPSELDYTVREAEGACTGWYLSGGRSCRSRDIKIILIAALIAAQVVGLPHYLLRGPGANHIRVHKRSWIACI